MGIRQSIIKTLSFFKIFGQPLTFLELKNGLLTGYPLAGNDLWTVLAEEKEMEADRGFFFLSTERSLIEHRLARDFWQKKKLIIAQKAARLLSGVPFIKLVAICNSLGFGSAEEKSDIDFFIITGKGRLWTVRFFCNLILRLFNLRTYGSKTTDRICLSFFIDENNLSLEELVLKDAGNDVGDPYLIYWITQLIPLINREKGLERFWSANAWVKKHLANFNFEDLTLDYRQVGVNAGLEFCRKFKERIMFGWLGNWLEKFFNLWQLRKIRFYLAGCQNQDDSAIIISDGILKLHRQDRRKEYRKKWLESSII